MAIQLVGADLHHRRPRSLKEKGKSFREADSRNGFVKRYGARLDAAASRIVEVDVLVVGAVVGAVRLGIEHMRTYSVKADLNREKRIRVIFTIELRHQ